MGSSEVVTAFIAALLGSGGVAFITAVLNGYKSIKNGARLREKETIADLVSQRKEAWIERDIAVDQRDYWRDRTGKVEFLLRSNGIDIPIVGEEPQRPPNTEGKGE